MDMQTGELVVATTAIVASNSAQQVVLFARLWVQRQGGAHTLTDRLHILRWDQSASTRSPTRKRARQSCTTVLVQEVDFPVEVRQVVAEAQAAARSGQVPSSSLRQLITRIGTLKEDTPGM